jgi:hypothetical protein
VDIPVSDFVTSILSECPIQALTQLYISTAVRTQGELYGGSMFHPSAATDTLQGRAIQKINETWGEDAHRGWSDYKNIGIPVCKKKYRPFEFQIKQKNKLGEVEISVVRMYGCSCHSNIRKKIILQHGERNGWEPFGQWSLSKAKAAAKKETQRLNAELNNLSCSSDPSISRYDFTSEEENTSLCFVGDAKQQQPWQTLCANGSCNWKIRGKTDDISSEIEKEHFKRIKV